jgi:hypothetical protein
VVPYLDTSDYATSGTASPASAAITVALIGVAGFVSLLVLAIVLWRQAAARARAATVAETEAEKRKLSPGYAIVHGQVETGDALPAVSVRIRQGGRDYRVKNGWRHVWTEIDRQIDARPFVLRLVSGERVKVVPGNDVLLVDFLDVGTIEPIASGDGQRAGPEVYVTRLRTASLSPNDFAYATGRLVPPVSAAAYRGGEEVYSLHPLPRDKMLISAEPLEERYARRADFHLRWTLACAAALLFANGVLFGTYWTELVSGRLVDAHAVQVRTWTTSGKHGPNFHYSVNAFGTLDGRDLPLTTNTNFAFYQSAKSDLARGRAVPVPFIVVPSSPQIYAVGTRPTLGLLTCVFAWFLFSGLASGYYLRARHTRPWYDRDKVVDAGSGPIGASDALV